MGLELQYRLGGSLPAIAGGAGRRSTGNRSRHRAKRGQCIGGAAYRFAAKVEDRGVNHRRADIGVARLGPQGSQRRSRMGLAGNQDEPGRTSSNQDDAGRLPGTMEDNSDLVCPIRSVPWGRMGEKAGAIESHWAQFRRSQSATLRGGPVHLGGSSEGVRWPGAGATAGVGRLGGQRLASSLKIAANGCRAGAPGTLRKSGKVGMSVLDRL
jgi:hypothetical protein